MDTLLLRELLVGYGVSLSTEAIIALIKSVKEFIKKHPRLADQGVRDYGRGIGKGKGQGSVNRTGGPRGRNND